MCCEILEEETGPFSAEEALAEADAHYLRGRFKEAEPLYLLALVYLERTHEETHPRVLECLEKLGDTFMACNQPEDAAPVYSRLADLRYEIDQRSATVLVKLARALKGFFD